MTSSHIYCVKYRYMYNGIMNTTLTIKTDKNLRNEAKKTADELGLPLTTVINGYLRQFVREGRFAVSIEPNPLKSKLELWEKISMEMDKKKKRESYDKVEDLIQSIHLQ